MANPNAERELDTLEAILRSPTPVRQRDVARVIGLSLGMTNAILRRLARKGWLTMRRVNSRNIQYIASPKGVDEIARRSYRYLRRTVGNIVRYRKAIENLVRDARDRRCTVVILVGESDLDFVVEHACRGLGLGFRRVRSAVAGARGRGTGRALVLYSETILPSGRQTAARGNKASDSSDAGASVFLGQALPEPEA